MQENGVEIVGRLIPDSGKIHQNQEVYSSVEGGIMGTLKASHYKDPPKIVITQLRGDNHGNHKCSKRPASTC